MPSTRWVSMSATRSIPGEDLHDGITYEMFLERVTTTARCNILYDPSHFLLQQLDYLRFIDIYHPRIRIFTRRTPSSIRAAGGCLFRVPAVVIALAVSGRWAMGRWSSARSFPSCHSTNSTAGQCSNGSAASRTASKARRKAPCLSRRTLSRSPRAFDDFAASGVDQAANRGCWG